VQVKPGDVLSFEVITNGCRLYIAFRGGIEVPGVMGSKSTYLRGELGGFKGRALQAGDELNIADATSKTEIKSIPEEYIFNIGNEQSIRIIAGTEVSQFTSTGLSTFVNSLYTISSQSDRMGYRLSGPKIGHKAGADILSSGISDGAIQVPGHGEPIIMLADHQTVGGYAKIANVISVDLPVLGQMKPGDRLGFTEVRLDEAHRLLFEQQKKLNSMV